MNSKIVNGLPIFLPSLTDASTDVSKQIFKCIHQIDILRHKGIKKSALIAQKI